MNIEKKDEFSVVRRDCWMICNHEIMSALESSSQGYVSAFRRYLSHYLYYLDTRSGCIFYGQRDIRSIV